MNGKSVGSSRHEDAAATERFVCPRGHRHYEGSEFCTVCGAGPVREGGAAARGRRMRWRVSAWLLRQAMGRACRTAEIPLYSPHDLRHRRASLWHGQGLTTRELMERGGWAKAEIAISTYSHVMPRDEVTREDIEAVLGRV